MAFASTVGRIRAVETESIRGNAGVEGRDRKEDNRGASESHITALAHQRWIDGRPIVAECAVRRLRRTVWADRTKAGRLGEQLLLGGGGTPTRTSSPDHPTNHRNGTGKGSAGPAMALRDPTWHRSTVRLQTGTIFRKAAACAPGHRPFFEAAAERSPFVPRRPALTRRQGTWDSSRAVGQSSVSFPGHRRSAIETVSSTSPTDNAMRGRQVGRFCRQRKRNKPLKVEPQGCHRLEIESEGLREERSAKGLRKSEGAAQPGTVSPVLVASRCFMRRRGKEPHEGNCIAVVRRG